MAGALAAGMTVAAPAASAVTPTGDFFNVRDYGAVGNGTTDDTAAIQAAITAAQVAGGTVYIPGGTYLVSGAGNQILLVTSDIRILGDGYRSTLLVSSSVPSTRDVIRLAPTANVDVDVLWGIDGIHIVAQSGTPARHGINIDLTLSGQYMSKLLLQNCFIGLLGGRALYLTNPTNQDGLFTSAIENNLFIGGLSLLRAGDSINIFGNTITGPNTGIELSQVSGAANIVIAFNNITSVGGAVRITAGDQIKIMYNQIEQTATSTSPDNAQISIKGANSASAVIYTEIVGNNLNAYGNHAANNIRLDYASYTKIRDNIITPGSGAAIAVLSTSDHTEIEYNNFGPSQTANALVSDAGVATIGVLQPLTLLNSWTNPDIPTFGAAGVTKLSNGSVFLSGVIASGTTTFQTTLCVLPVGMRPALTHRFSVASTNSSGPVLASIDVKPNGNVVLLVGGSSYLSLDGISFLAV